jgi:hypothetical protein
MNEWTSGDWILIIAAISTAVVSIIAAWKANSAANSSASASNSANEAVKIVDATHSAVNSKMDKLLEANSTIARAEGRSAGVVAGQAGELPPLPNGNR